MVYVEGRRREWGCWGVTRATVKRSTCFTHYLLSCDAPLRIVAGQRGGRGGVAKWTSITVSCGKWQNVGLQLIWKSVHGNENGSQLPATWVCVREELCVYFVFVCACVCVLVIVYVCVCNSTKLPSWCSASFLMCWQFVRTEWDSQNNITSNTHTNTCKEHIQTYKTHTYTPKKTP